MGHFEPLLSPQQCHRLAINGYRVNRQFASKKNRVFLVDADRADGTPYRLVVKLTTMQPADVGREARLQQLLYQQGMTVPRILLSDPGCLVMQYIEGETLLHYFERLEQSCPLSAQILQTEVRPMACQLAIWLKDFYQATTTVGQQLIMSDVNLRNFLVCDNQIYGLDFEDARPGDAAEDAGRILAFGLTYDPPFTDWKWATSRVLSLAFQKVLRLSPEQLQAAMQAELTAITQRRNLRLL